MVNANMVVTDHASHSDNDRGQALATLRGILVSSLSKENLSPNDIDDISSPDSPPVAPARRKRKVTFLDNNTAGAAPVEPSQRQGSRPSSAKQGSSNCLAGEGVSEVSDGTSPPRDQGKENTLQRDERLRLVKEKQNEERQRKLEELKQQAMAAQKFREQKEEERRKRLEDMRVRDTDRRHQVEERKRQIWEAERDRREAILRKNQEREARIESKKKNERSSIVFAFGSSTPRMLEPADTGGSYWATRRATSTSNVMMLSMSAAPGPLTRRSSERELDGSKKRATSAGGIHRSKAEDAARLTASSIYDVFQWDSPCERPTLMSLVDVTPSIPPLADAATTKFSGEEIDGEGSSTPIPITTTIRAARRKTDLMPTLPSPRDLTPGRGQTSRPIRSPGFRSGEVTPSRPQSSLSQHSVSSGAAMSSSVHSALKSRPQTAPRRQRPYSIAVTGISSTPSSPDTNKPNATPDHRSAKSPSVSGTDKPPIPKVHTAKKPLTPKPDLPKKPTDKLTKSAKSSASPTPKATPLQSPGVEVPTSELISVEATTNDETATTTTVTSVTTVNTVEGENVLETIVHNEVTVVSQTADNESVTETIVTKVEESTTVVQPETIKEPTPPAYEPVKEEPLQQQEPFAESLENEMTASMIAKTRITTEEEAKAALAERRRLAREQAEREAELERQRLEAERLAEEERLRQEEEEQRRMEEEQLRLLEEARKAEEERLRLAIEETQKREEEEKRRKEEEAKLKQEKEEAERKAKEEAEKQRQEMELRLKKEEEDRQARRKRVEAIMLRTRGKGTTPTSTPTKEDGDESPNEEAKQEPEKANIQETFLNSERSHSDANLTVASVPKHNGHQNGVDNVVDQNNVTNNLLDLSLESDSKIHPSIQPQPIGEQIIVAPTTTTPTNGKLSNEDSVNFNTPPPTSPFIAFQDNKKQDATVNDLLS